MILVLGFGLFSRTITRVVDNQGPILSVSRAFHFQVRGRAKTDQLRAIEKTGRKDKAVALKRLPIMPPEYGFHRIVKRNVQARVHLRREE